MNCKLDGGAYAETNEFLSKTGAEPDEIAITHHCSKQLGAWITKVEALYDRKGKPHWVEHPRGRSIDVVALPLKEIDSEVQIYPLDLSLASVDILPQPSMPVAIIGYPFGLANAVAWPIWKTGHIASDPDLDYDGKPVFLIDATTRGGMSGSPVVLRTSGVFSKSDGSIAIAPAATKFLGVYSGRIHGEAEIGRVWRPIVIDEILQKATGR